MAQLVEAVEHELRRAGLAHALVRDAHLHRARASGRPRLGTETAHEPMPEGTSVMFDFGGVVDGYCSDFGRTIYCGEPPDDYRERLRGHARRPGGRTRRCRRRDARVAR